MKSNKNKSDYYLEYLYNIHLLGMTNILDIIRYFIIKNINR